MPTGENKVQNKCNLYGKSSRMIVVDVMYLRVKEGRAKQTQKLYIKDYIFPTLPALISDPVVIVLEGPRPLALL